MVRSVSCQWIPPNPADVAIPPDYCRWGSLDDQMRGQNCQRKGQYGSQKENGR